MEQYTAKNAAIVGVSFDSVEDNRAFSEKFSFNYPLLSDVERTMGMAYGACDDASASSARRIGVVVDGDGIVKSYEPKANARSFPADVLATL